MSAEYGLARAILEKLIDKDQFGRAVGEGAPCLYKGIEQHCIKEENTDRYIVFDTVIRMHRDYLVDFQGSEDNLTEATIKITKNGLEYYKAKTKTFI